MNRLITLLSSSSLLLLAQVGAAADDTPQTGQHPKTGAASTGPMAGTDSSQTTPSLKRAGTEGFAALDVDRDGKISKDEAQKDQQLAGTFAKADENGDGKIDQGEFARSTASNSPSQTTPVTGK